MYSLTLTTMELNLASPSLRPLAISLCSMHSLAEANICLADSISFSLGTKARSNVKHLRELLFSIAQQDNSIDINDILIEASEFREVCEAVRTPSASLDKSIHEDVCRFAMETWGDSVRMFNEDVVKRFGG